ncbi:MAG: hypothetical protein ABUS79_04880 [Pseudomonadota bacterium]
MLFSLVPPVVCAFVEVLSATTCPSREEVSSELSRLTTAATGASSREQEEQEKEQGGARLNAVLGAAGDGRDLSITLRASGGRLLAERTLARSGSCADMAAAAAVVIAAWQIEMRADLGPDLPAAKAASVPSVPIRAGPPALTAAPAPALVGASRVWDIGVAALASREGANFAPGLAVDAQVDLVHPGFGGRIGFILIGDHEVPLGPVPGRATWSRAAFEAGVRRRAWLGAVTLDGHVDVEGALLRVAGAGFASNYAIRGFDLGIGAGLRLAWPLGTAAPATDGPSSSRRAIAPFIAPFLGLEAWAWPGQKAVVAAGTGAEAALPVFEVRAAAGVMFGRFR